MATKKTTASVKASAPSPEPINTYGYQLLPGKTQLAYDFIAFSERVPIDAGAPPRADNFRNIADKIIPGYFEWHDWTNRMVDGFCNHGTWRGKKVVRGLALAGCSSAAKTHNVCGMSVLWWLVRPDVSSVTFCTTSRDSLRRRAWAQIGRLNNLVNRSLKMKFGHFTDSKMIWQAVYGDTKHAIVGRAVEEGSLERVVADINGLHTQRQMLVIDEATAPKLAAAFEAMPNLWEYPDEFIVVVIGNPTDKRDRHGLFCTPADGWDSVGIETDSWLSIPHAEIGGAQALVLRFDKLKSPNYVRGKEVSPHLPSKESVEVLLKNKSWENNPSAWSHDRGFWPPEGILPTVFSQTFLESTGAFEKSFKFQGPTRVVCGFDPAFGGGDSPEARFARIGAIDDNGNMAIQLLPPMSVPLNATAINSSTGKRTPLHYQLAYGIRRLCEQMGCPPDNLNVDDSGNTGVCDIISREWSDKIMRTRFGDAASEMPVSHENPMTCHEWYKNKATELWYSGREFFNAKQVRGLDFDTATEMCARYYKGDTNGNRLMIEPKESFKARNSNRSPDKSDALFLCLDAARRRGVHIQPLGLTITRYDEWNHQVEVANDVLGNPTHEPQSADEENYVEESPEAWFIQSVL